MLSDRASHNFTQPLVTFYIGHIFYVFRYSSQKMMHISLFPAIKREGAIKSWTNIVMNGLVIYGLVCRKKEERLQLSSGMASDREA